MVDKSSIIEAIRQQLEANAALHQQSLEEIQQSIAGETKRTAGDKHETALAMLQTERERIGRHLQQVNEQLGIVLQLANSLNPNTDGKGSLITTDKGLFFIAVAIGKLEIDNHIIFGISPAAPITAHLLRTTVNNSFTLQQQTYTVLHKQ